MCTSQSPLVFSEGFDRFAIGRAEHGEHKEWARAAAARRRLASDQGRARFRRRNPSRRCGGTCNATRSRRAASSSRVGHLQVHTGTGTGTGTGTRIACANGTASLSVVVQPREHHEQHGAAVVVNALALGAEAIPHVRGRSAPGAVSAAAFSKAVPPRRSARVRDRPAGTQLTRCLSARRAARGRRAPRACAGAGGGTCPGGHPPGGGASA